MNRVCIYPKDIQRITGKSERQSRRILNEIRILHKKERHQLVTVSEFGNYMGISLGEIVVFLK